ncbi:hypothetical protein CDD81_448 [Ophiocordyceps australis]|uniref:BZIP domain-containing protein n=1 Tax=Ophiocordyceps australis TaxID=1399860 RepID=A0A2C5Y1S9_9HYPO|nr:hypothetical protein CDD81_448 [Ophiocordyceps australis]
MSSAGDNGSLPPNFFLTPQQQSLLFTALNSNKATSSASPTNNGLSLSPNSFTTTSMQTLENPTLQESPYLDTYDYEFGDSTFDFSFASADQTQAHEPATVRSESNSTENDANEKRSHPDDDDDDASAGNDSKRREGGEKVPKKPGRKPLTSEPTSKRKAQNRAAQRAFRERKEKHLKDLETKVHELEKESREANHENSKLRSQLDRITHELDQYKQRLAIIATSTKPTPKDKVSFGSAAVHNLGDVSFQFEFPKFGTLPGPAPVKRTTSNSLPISPQSNGQGASPAQSQGTTVSRQPVKQPQDNTLREDFNNKSSGTFTPALSTSHRAASMASFDSGHGSLGLATGSPSASSSSNAGSHSSCGTSPEPLNHSPMGSKPLETLTTIGEEHPITNDSFSQFANIDVSSPGFDWLANQNGGQFDPQLFGGYREPQENILSNTNLDDLFNDSLAADFLTPYNMPSMTATSSVTTPPAPKKNLIDEIDAQQNAVDDEPVVSHNVNCSEIWDKLQGCPKAVSGEFDLDGLCSELTKKAKCSGSGPVVAERDFDSILRKYMGKDVSSDCVADKLGIAVDRSKDNGVAML